MSNSTFNKSASNAKEGTLAIAAKLVEQAIDRHQEYCDLDDLLNGSSSDLYVQPLLEPSEELMKTKQVDVPRVLLDKLDDMECRCFCGLLPEIGRAWLTVDNRLYIWNLSDTKDIVEYSDQDQVIITVGLVKPRANVFGDQISYVLVVSTPLQVILLGVSINSQVQTQPLELYATKIAIPSDDVQMQHITGTDDGRIFMIGNDRGLYEVEYSHPNQWFKNGRMICRTAPYLARYAPTFTPKFLKPANPPPIKSIAIDNERKMLNILYDNSSIEIIYLGDPDNSYKSVHKYSNVVQDALYKCRQQSKFCNPEELEVNSIHVISEAESKKIHLLAITVAGYRLYFSYYKDAFRPVDSSARTMGLELGHIRGPPQALNGSSSQTRRIFTNTYYDCGICLAAHPQSDTVDQIEMTATTSAKATPENQNPTSSLGFMMNTNRSNYVQTALSFDIPSKILLIIEADRERVGKHAIKEIAQQLSDPPRQFMLMSNFSVHFYQKLRPVNVLYNMLSHTRGIQKDASLIQAFLDRYGVIETCAMCLSIICCTDKEQIKSRAKSIFFGYSGAPSAAYANQIVGNHLGRVNGPTGIHYSGKHDGLVLYFARIISPVWKLKMFAIRGSGADVLLQCTRSVKLLYSTKMKLMKLKLFMESNSYFHGSANAASPTLQTPDRNLAQLEFTEQKSMHDLYLLVVQCIDAISFIEFIMDSDAQLIISNYLGGLAESIYDLDLSSIVSTEEGKRLTRTIVIGTITRYARISHTGYGIVSRQLEKLCRSFYSPSDIQFFKGIECVQRALLDESEYGRISSLKESLEHFKSAAKDASDDEISSVCQIYKESSFHVGIIELGLERAEQLDPLRQALATPETAPDYHDENSTPGLMNRAKAYEYIFDALNDVFELKRAGRLQPGRAPISDFNAYYKTVIDTAIHSKDKLFHFRLYDWLAEKNAMNELLSVDAYYLIPYLEKHSKNKKASLEFLRIYYGMRERYVESARCSEKLADLPFEESQFTQEDRVHYLSRAIISGRHGSINNPSILSYVEELKKKLQQVLVEVQTKGKERFETRN